MSRFDLLMTITNKFFCGFCFAVHCLILSTCGGSTEGMTLFSHSCFAIVKFSQHADGVLSCCSLSITWKILEGQTYSFIQKHSTSSIASK